jgi:hypothetical protein
MNCAAMEQITENIAAMALAERYRLHNSGGTNVPPGAQIINIEKRVGKDGKMYPTRRKRKAPQAKKAEDLPL